MGENVTSLSVSMPSIIFAVPNQPFILCPQVSLPSEGIPSMPLHVCEPGQWYLVVICKGCGTRGPILRDLSEGQSKIMAVYTWRCPVCDHIDQYDSEDIERYQHPDAPPSKT